MVVVVVRMWPSLLMRLAVGRRRALVARFVFLLVLVTLLIVLIVTLLLELGEWALLGELVKQLGLEEQTLFSTWNLWRGFWWRSRRRCTRGVGCRLPGYRGNGRLRRRQKCTIDVADAEEVV